MPHDRSFCFRAALVAGVAAAALPAQDSPSDLGARLRGIWSSDTAELVFQFEGDRCVVAHGLQQTLMHVRYDDADGTITRHLLGQPDRESVSEIAFADDDHATLTGKDQTLELTRIAGPGDPVPAAVDTEPMEFGSRTVEAEELAAIQRELAERREREQEVRRQLTEVEAAVRKRYADEGNDEPAFRAPEVQEVMSRMASIDGENTLWLRELMADIGWIDAARFGDEANQSAFLIVQHCGNVAMLRPVLDAMKAEFDRGHAPSGPRYALMYDRLTLSLGGQQRYGSQLVGGPDGTMSFPRLEDPANVDAQRESVGLGTLAEYAERFASPGRKLELPAGYRSRSGR